MKDIKEMTQLEVAQYIVDEFRLEHKKSGNAIKVISLRDGLEHLIKLDNDESIKVCGNFSAYLKRAEQ